MLPVYLSYSLVPIEHLYVIAAKSFKKSTFISSQKLSRAVKSFKKLLKQQRAAKCSKEQSGAYKEQARAYKEQSRAYKAVESS